MEEEYRVSGRPVGKAICRFMLLAAAGLLLTMLVPSRQAVGKGDFHEVAKQLGQILARDAATLDLDMAEGPVALHEGVLVFYRQRQYAPAWFEEQSLTEQARELTEILRQARSEGLVPEDYHVSAIAALMDLQRIFNAYEELWNASALARLDILLTNAFLRYATHLTLGRVDPAAVYPQEWRAVQRRADAVQVLRLSLDQGRVAEALADLVPAYPEYFQLRDYLARCRRLAEQGGWPQIPAGRTVNPGEEDWRIPWLRRRLVRVGDLDREPDSDPQVFDGETVAALMRFQQRHGLKTDGVLGPETVAALNVTVEERIRQIEINLERWRWLPKALGNRYLLVNIAGFNLTVVENGAPVLKMAVVVGTPFRRTPVFSANLGYLIFSPYWNVPVTILREDKLPLIKADPDYLAAHHYEIVSWQDFPNRLLDPKALDWSGITASNFPGLLRQKPGPWNPLGRVKFMFPNDFSVYLHDTPDRHLFALEQRSFSSGCIRIERPFDLALYLLQGQKGWDARSIRKAMSSNLTRRVDLQRPIPVHILYQTAWVDGQGRLQTRQDLYQRDAALYAALRDRGPRALQAVRDSLPQAPTGEDAEPLTRAGAPLSSVP
jgi:murein L,D-transpeptidase YcbB/YkuD